MKDNKLDMRLFMETAHVMAKKYHLENGGDYVVYLGYAMKELWKYINSLNTVDSVKNEVLDRKLMLELFHRRKKQVGNWETLSWILSELTFDEFLEFNNTKAISLKVCGKEHPTKIKNKKRLYEIKEATMSMVAEGRENALKDKKRLSNQLFK